MNGMFGNCSALLSLPDISKWNINKICYMNDMFNGCQNSIVIPEQFQI